MKHTNGVITPKNHTHATVVFITMVKAFMIKVYIYKKNVRHRLSLISLFFLVIPQIPSLVFFRFLRCKEKRLISCIAILQFCFFYRVSTILSLLLSFPRHNLLSSSNFCDTRISISSVTLSLLDCSSCILLCNSTRRF